MSLFTISVNLAPRSASSERPALRVGEGWETVGLSDGSRPQGEPQAPYMVLCVGDPNPGMWSLWTLESSYLRDVGQWEFCGSSLLTS